MKGLGLFTSKIHHHASFSGYEQLIDYIEAEHVNAMLRTSDTSLFKRSITKLLRSLVTVSNWYQWQDLMAELDAYRFLKSTEAPNPVIHLLYGDSMLGWLPRMKRYFNFTLVATVHACPSDMTEIYRSPHRLAGVDHFIILAPNQRDALTEMGVPKHKISLIPHGIDQNTIELIGENVANTPIKADSKVQNSKFNVLGVGNWRRDFKMYNEIFEQFEGADWIQFTMVIPEHRQQEMRKQSNITVLSGISDSELLQLYDTSDILLMAVEDAAANNVILEAMAHGLPILGNKHEAIEWYAGNSMKTYDSVSEAVSQIKLLADSNEVLVDLSQNALRRAETYEWSQIADKLKGLYKNLSRS